MKPSKQRYKFSMAEAERLCLASGYLPYNHELNPFTEGRGTDAQVRKFQMQWNYVLCLNSRSSEMELDYSTLDGTLPKENGVYEMADPVVGFSDYSVVEVIESGLDYYLVKSYPSKGESYKVGKACLFRELQECL